MVGFLQLNDHCLHRVKGLGLGRADRGLVEDKQLIASSIGGGIFSSNV